MSEYGEPWVRGGAYEATDRDGNPFWCGEYWPTTEQYDRIVACVNALDGVPNEILLRVAAAPRKFKDGGPIYLTVRRLMDIEAELWKIVVESGGKA